MADEKMSKDSACVGTTREEQKQLMVSAVEALSSPPPAPHVAINNESSDGPFKLQPNTAKPTTAIRSTPNFSKKATASRVDSRLPAVKSTSVFDRLYKSHTVASKSHNLTTRAKMRPSTRAKLPYRGTSAKKSASDIEKDLLIFSSMSISRSNRVSTPHKISWTSKGGKKSSSSPSFATPQPRKKRPSSSSYQAPHTAPTKSSSAFTGSSSMSTPIATTPRSSKRVYEFSPRMKPITKLYYVSKFHPGLGLEPVAPISLGYTFFQTFCEYETGGIDSETIAKEIFLAFFKKDFPSIRHWKLHEPTLAKVNSKKNNDSPSGRGGGGTIAYAIKMNATYSWKDTYRFANARGVVRIKGIQKEIRVENFTYDLTGDP